MGRPTTLLASVLQNHLKDGEMSSGMFHIFPGLVTCHLASMFLLQFCHNGGGLRKIPVVAKMWALKLDN